MSIASFLASLSAHPGLLALPGTEPYTIDMILYVSDGGLYSGAVVSFECAFLSDPFEPETFCRSDPSHYRDICLLRRHPGCSIVHPFLTSDRVSEGLLLYAGYKTFERRSSIATMPQLRLLFADTLLRLFIYGFSYPLRTLATMNALVGEINALFGPASIDFVDVDNYLTDSYLATARTSVLCAVARRDGCDCPASPAVLRLPSDLSSKFSVAVSAKALHDALKASAPDR